MKSKLFTYSSFLIFGLAFLSSCSEDEDICSSTPKVNNQIISRNIQEKGRAENGASPPTLNGLIHPVLPLNWP